MDKQFRDGAWEKRLIRHMGTARSDLDLEFLNEKAQKKAFTGRIPLAGPTQDRSHTAIEAASE